MVLSAAINTGRSDVRASVSTSAGSVSGTGTIVIGAVTQTVYVSASTDGSSAGTTGSFSFATGSGPMPSSVVGPVTCVFLQGSRAVVGGRLDFGASPYLLFITDGGPTGVSDTLEVVYQSGGPDCTSQGTAPTTLSAGNFTVSTGATPVSAVPVTISPPDPTTGTQPVALTFTSVSVAGTTTVTTSSTGPAVPSGFALGTPPVFYEIASTAVFPFPVTICVTYAVTWSPPDSLPVLLHYVAGVPEIVPTSPDPVNPNTICGTVMSFSPFLVAGRLPYSFSGFFNPVSNPPVVNVAKAGSAIPMKFSLGGDQGLGILAAGSPSSQRIACPRGSNGNDVDTTTGSPSGLTYLPNVGRYRYVWQTERSWVGTCRRFSLRLIDGSEHTADFKFRGVANRDDH